MLEEQVALLRQRLLGRKSEQAVDPATPQMALFNEVEHEVELACETTEEEVVTPAKRRGKRNPLPARSTAHRSYPRKTFFESHLRLQLTQKVDQKAFPLLVVLEVEGLGLKLLKVSALKAPAEVDSYLVLEANLQEIQWVFLSMDK